MPGHIIHAACPCGYQKQLMPGASTFGDKEYRMAYSASGKSVGTFDVKTVENEELEIIADPFLSVDWIEDNASDTPDKPPAPPILIRCPRCQQTSLVLEWAGMWD